MNRTIGRFAEEYDRPFYGEVDGGTVCELSAAPYSGGTPTGRTFRRESLRVLAPCEPSTIIGLAGNYPDHTWGRKPDQAEPRPFFKPPSALIGPDESIVIPDGAGRVDAEGELVVVIGRRAQKVPAQSALEYVYGVTCGNDVTSRLWQKNDLSWWRAKGTDTFAAIGPYVVSGLDPGGLSVRCMVNGREVQKCEACNMHHGVAETISFVSRFVTLEPGDLIFTGTAGEPGELRVGDTVVVEIPGVGSLSNPVR